MTIAPDLLLRDVITDALAELKARPDLVDQVFEGFNSTTRTEVKTYLASAKIDIRLGWTQQSTIMPCVAVTLPGEQESQQYVGSEPGPDYDTDTQEWVPSSWVDETKSPDAYTEAEIAQFTGSVDAAIYALNATEATWVAAMVKWSMLRNRRSMELDGLFEQRISVTDFMPASEYPQPDPAYTRVVKLQYSTLVNYTYDDTSADALLQGSSVVVTNTAE